MNKEEITALASEYAEEYTKKKYPNVPGHVRERIVEGRLEHMEDFIPWLLRSYCLVEKDKVRGEYLLARADYRTSNGMPTVQEYHIGEMSMIERLFPELGKEVE